MSAKQAERDRFECARHTPEVSDETDKHSFFLHDGRARGLMEAVLWHGGEAKKARDAVLKFTQAERDALLKFLGSL